MATDKGPIPDRDIRQRDIAAPEKLAETTAYVIGTGAIGRQVATQLASIGAGHIVLVDFDTVGPENLAAQGFFEDDLDDLKVDAVSRTCRRLNSEIKVTAVPDKFKRSIIPEHGPGPVFACVDKMSARSFIWRACKDVTELFVDGRMAAEVCRILTVRGKRDHKFYDSTLFSDEEAFEGTCTAKTTLYCANVVAGFMVAQLTKQYRGIPYDRDVQLNILANEMRFETTTDKTTAEDQTPAA